VISLTQTAGLNPIEDSTNVNVIATGVVDREHYCDCVDDLLFAKYENRALCGKKGIVSASLPPGRKAQADDSSGVATFLPSGESGYICSHTYNVDGGHWMS
jgi:NAD(P)-dependent dehydrogenase (short-subunit alcohol dehydrogenase family)